jgi:hypothetical protein
MIPVDLLVKVMQRGILGAPRDRDELNEVDFGGVVAQGKWYIRGYDTFENQPYSLDGEWDDEAQAVLRAKAHLGQIERTQLSEDSGGQDEGGIQDQVWVVRPDGTEFQVWG